MRIFFPKYRRGQLLFVLLASWLCVGCALAQSLKTNVPSERLSGGAYVSPDGGYTVTLPPLIQPGARIEERQVSPVEHGVFFIDDFGNLYYVLRTDNAKANLTLERISDGFAVGEYLREKLYAATDRGNELRLLGINKGGSPIVARTREKGEWVERKNDQYEAWSIFIHDVHIYQVTAGVADLRRRSEMEMFASAKKNLEEFLKGLTIKPKKVE